MSTNKHLKALQVSRLVGEIINECWAGVVSELGPHQYTMIDGH